MIASPRRRTPRRFEGGWDVDTGRMGVDMHSRGLYSWDSHSWDSHSSPAAVASMLLRQPSFRARGTVLLPAVVATRVAVAHFDAMYGRIMAAQAQRRAAVLPVRVRPCDLPAVMRWRCE